jgi:hypothetical protein
MIIRPYIVTQIASGWPIAILIHRGAFRLWPVRDSSGHEAHDEQATTEPAMQEGPLARKASFACSPEPIPVAEWQVRTKGASQCPWLSARQEACRVGGILRFAPIAWT